MRSDTRIVVAFAATIGLSAFLLFSIQPLFTKMALPLLGGSPAVWSVALVFFQTVLLAGYAYAHLSTRFLSVRVGAAVHIVLLAVGFIFLPPVIADAWRQPPESGQAQFVFLLYLAALGVPLFALSANSPLLQAWFARSGHRDAADPYFLYAASNVGSFAALIGYALLIEPILALGAQGTLWTVGFAILVALIACLAIAMNRRIADAAPQAAAARISPWRLIGWITYGCIPSGLLVAVTAQISIDIASAPFLWIVPLALFLLTTIIAFARRPLLGAAGLSKALPFLVAAALIALYAHHMLPMWVALVTHLTTFFAVAWFCHARLAESRPAAGSLTVFYLAMSFGGVLGGLFASLLAPSIFAFVAEYVLLLIAVLLLRPEFLRLGHARISTVLVIGAAAIIGVYALGLANPGGVFSQSIDVALMLMGVALIFLALERFTRSAHAVAALVVIPLAFLQADAAGSLYSDRTFFGIVRVTDTADGRFRLMTHGTTLHGAQETRPLVMMPGAWAPEPLTYYHRTGGMARVISAMQEARGGAMGAVAAIGLGTGSAFCHRQPGERWTAFEIDQSVIDAATDPALFQFMPVCAPDARIVVGDARLTIADEPDGSFDLVLVDAFSSDSIPVHLMTREAIRLYISKTIANGVVVLHISNRYLELESVLAAIAQEEGLAIRSGIFRPAEDGIDNRYVNASHVAVIAREDRDFGPLLDDARWQVPASGETRAWTDDYANVLGALWRSR